MNEEYPTGHSPNYVWYARRGRVRVSKVLSIQFIIPLTINATTKVGNYASLDLCRSR